MAQGNLHNDRFLFLVLILLACPLPSSSQSSTPQALTPAPAPAPTSFNICNITQVIEAAGQFSNFIKLLKDTKVEEKFQAQANQTDVGITVFAPVDKAFGLNPAATLFKNMTEEQKVSVSEMHGLTRWFSLADLQQTNENITKTFASYNAPIGGKYEVNISDNNGKVTVQTLWSRGDIVSTLYNEVPCSIFAINQVLLPEDLFGVPPPTPPPAPSPVSDENPLSNSSPPYSSNFGSESPTPPPNHARSSLISCNCNALLLIICFLASNLFL